ncbi:hypothetical protein [Pedobacter africanus]|uniref:Uncharacterized protein n=1 Tax=Pedobacter africanus TaxID=151894 RepID=A0A1W2CU78_9SPHI|nr:hypothetical protein [Pedobacter africanus]SMC88516.1 hypothetical protein SAMN04488524_3198 [Pedobacter africanus]
MKILNYYIFALALALFSFHDTHGQSYGITDLHKFMQLNADTTFILEYQSGWLLPPQYWLVSKKGDTTTAYIYDLPPKYNVLMPKSIRSAIYRSNGFNPSRKIEINQFFRPVPTPAKYKGKIWDILMKEEPWQIPDDKVDGTRCPPNKNRVEIEDGGSVNLYLITAKEIKTLSFYAPHFYEEKCPGRKGRQSIIRIDKLFRDLFERFP